jgi:predicted N-acetyltransferase YhbS
MGMGRMVGSRDWRLRSWRTYRKRVGKAVLRIWLRLSRLLRLGYPAYYGYGHPAYYGYPRYYSYGFYAPRPYYRRYYARRHYYRY